MHSRLYTQRVFQSRLAMERVPLQVSLQLKYWPLVGLTCLVEYVGDERYNPIWAELDRRQAVVFLHGSQVPSSTPYPHSTLGIPITEVHKAALSRSHTNDIIRQVPNETFKAAAHLVVTGHRRKFSNVKIILAHLGGTVPMLTPRVAVLSHHMGCNLSPEEIIEDFKTFYYETALSAYEPNLAAIEKFVQHDHILFGTDFPGN